MLFCCSEQTASETDPSTNGYLVADGDSPVTAGDGLLILPFGDPE